MRPFGGADLIGRPNRSRKPGPFLLSIRDRERLMRVGRDLRQRLALGEFGIGRRALQPPG